MNSEPHHLLWVLLCASLVFLMQPGFMCLEAGLTRTKNSINVALKNIADFGVSTLAYWAWGFALMFGTASSGYLGENHFFVPLESERPALSTFFYFQVVFCGTAVTIVSGAVAERMRFMAYLGLSLLLAGVVYPVFGHWAWGGVLGGAPGWLKQLGFVDFAGSSVVHSVGGAAALATVVVTGPRRGRFPARPGENKAAGSNVPLSMLGVALLWVGWVGFNGGSTLELSDAVPGIITKTILGGCSGLLVALITHHVQAGYPDVEKSANGSLAGLVAITANCHAVSAAEAILIGGVGALVMLAAEALMLRAEIDDVVGAVPVHLAAGAWGTVAVALFGDPAVLDTGLSTWQQLRIQALGSVICILWSGGLTYLVLASVNRITPLRVTAEEEEVGLNVAEHRAATGMVDLLRVMDRQAATQDLSLRAPVEPFTEIGRVAHHYNRVMERLERAAAEVDAVVRTAKDGILTFARESGQVLSANPSAELLFGSSAETLLARPFESLVVTEEGQPVSIDQVFEGTNLGQSTKAWGRREAHPDFPLEVSLTEAETKKGKIYIGTFRDISDRQELEAQLRHAQKMEAVGQLAGGVAHDFNNLLTIITGYSELALLQTDPADPRRQSLQQVCKASDRAASLTAQLLAFSRRRISKREVLSLESVVRGVDAMLRRLIGVDIKLNVQAGRDPAVVRVDRGQIEQIIMNLAINARDAMPEGGSITIETDIIELQGIQARRHPDIGPGRYAMLTVADTGTGMSPETQSRIFEPFFTTKDVDRGTGLGLSMVYGIVKHYEGSIRVDSQLGRGTTFTIFLPLHEGTTTLSDTPGTGEVSIAGQGTILVVEDEELVRQLVVRLLEACGYQVLAAEGGESALRQAEDFRGRIDLLLTDIVMPTMRGNELARRLRMSRPETRILFMSGYADMDLTPDNGDEPMEFIEKPFSAEALTQKVQGLMGKRSPTSVRSTSDAAAR